MAENQPYIALAEAAPTGENAPSRHIMHSIWKCFFSSFFSCKKNHLLIVYFKKEANWTLKWLWNWLSIQRKRQNGCQFKEKVNQPPVIIHPTNQHMFVGPLSPGADSKDYSACLHFKNHKQTFENPKISTRRHQTPDEGIRKLTYKSCTQEVLKKSRLPFCTDGLRGLFSANIGIQVIYITCSW